MAKDIFYEDLMENFDNNNLREKLMKLVNENKIIVVKGLNSAQRHTIYRQMYYPLKFEKILLNENEEENTYIRIYNYKIKNKENKEKKQDENERNKEEEYVLEDSEQSEEEIEDDSEYDSKSDDSYFTEEEEQITKLENLGDQIIERIVKNEKKLNRVINRVNLVILLNAIGWVMLYTFDPVRLIQIKTIECEAY